MKVLILSHNCISNYNNMGKAMCSIFSKFKKDELCQFYLYPSIPDIDYCNSYYRLTDIDVIKSFFSFKKKGQVIDKNKINDQNMLYENDKEKKVYKIKKSFFKVVFREFIWKFGFFNIKKIDNWILKEKPECIVFFPGNYLFSYDIALFLSRKYSIPIITYFMDNFYKIKMKNPFEKIHQKMLEKKILKLVSLSSLNITLSNEMTDFYLKEFKGSFVTIMLGSVLSKYKFHNPKKVKNIVYLGNLSYKRYEKLIEIGKALDELNNKNNENIKLLIYGNIYDSSILEQFSCVDSIEYKGFVKGYKYEEALEEADLLIHVESFEPLIIDKIKYSVSTKISQILTSGRCVIAYGPEIVSSILYLEKNDAAFVIKNCNDLISLLDKILHNYDLRSKLINNGYEVAKKYQDCYNNSKILYDYINKVCE